MEALATRLERLEFTAIKTLIPDAIIDLKYYGTDNFLKRQIYDKPYDILRLGTLEKLAVAASRLRELGYRLVIWDAYRPLAIQRLLWSYMPDTRFVAPPDRGSKHNRGCAVDLSLATLDGTILEMPSGFDDFTEKARGIDLVMTHDSEIINRLQMLQQAMLASGFELYADEWWHFVDSEWSVYTCD